MNWWKWTIMSKTLQEQHTKLNKTKNKQKEQKCRQSVVTGRQQLYCVVQSRSPSHCQMTTEKVQSSARDGMSSVTVHSWQMTAGCSMHVLKPLVRHGRRALNVWWTVLAAWRCHQSEADVECLRQMSGEGSQQGTTVLFHVDSGRKERTAGIWLAPKSTTSENRVAVVQLADSQCTNQGQQGMSWQRSPPDLELCELVKHPVTTAVMWVLSPHGYVTSDGVEQAANVRTCWTRPHKYEANQFSTCPPKQ